MAVATSHGKTGVAPSQHGSPAHVSVRAEVVAGGPHLQHMRWKGGDEAHDGARRHAQQALLARDRALPQEIGIQNGREALRCQPGEAAK